MKWKALLTPEWIWRHSIAILMVAELWLNSHYVQKAEYSADKKEFTLTLKTLSESITDLRFSIVHQQEQRDILNDHEKRIRALEKAVR